MSMPESKKMYIAHIRSNSAYPTFRNLIQIFGILFVGLGVVCIITGIVGAFMNYGKNGVAAITIGISGIIGGLICIVLGRLGTEVSSMIADIADSITESNSSSSTTLSTNQDGTPSNTNTVSNPKDSSIPSPGSFSGKKPLSEEDQETRANELLYVAKGHLTSGAKDFAIDVLQEIIRLYPSTRAADKARSSLKGQ